MKSNKKSDHSYDDIINMPNPTSKRHPRMSLYARAAQFSPFAALTGYDQVIREASRLTDVRMELSEDVIACLNEKMRYIIEHMEAEPIVTVTYFVPDEKKSGGRYVAHSGSIKKIKESDRLIIMDDGTHIPMDQVSNIDGEIFTNSDN